jgi:hypothetical protein
MQFGMDHQSKLQQREVYATKLSAGWKLKGDQSHYYCPLPGSINKLAQTWLRKKGNWSRGRKLQAFFPPFGICGRKGQTWSCCHSIFLFYFTCISIIQYLILSVSNYFCHPNLYRDVQWVLDGTTNFILGFKSYLYT